MAFFKFRWPGRKGQDDTKAARSRRMPQAESAAVLRRRARHRLIGATVLVALGVIGFPMLFDTQPRPIPVDIPISIPDRNKTPALVLPGNRAAAEAEAEAAGKLPTPAASAGLDEGEEIVSSAPVNAPAGKPPAASKPADTPVAETRKEPAAPKVETPHVAAAAPKREAKPETKPEPKPEPKPEARPSPAAVARADDAARARALLEGRTVPPATVVADNAPAAAASSDAAAARFVVQVGAFGDTAKAQEARAKLARSGLKTYVQSVDTKDGKRHRVRVGPFANRAEADQAAARIRGLDLPASILAL